MIMNRVFNGMFQGRGRYPSWRQIPATFGIIAITAFWFLVVESIYGHSATGFMNAGALAGVSVQSGQWYRLISSLFVHLSTVHLLLNMISLWSLFIVELIFGTRPFLVLYGVSGIVGNLISVLLMNPFVLSAGASGAVFGIFGAIFAVSFQGGLNKVLRNQLILLLAANLIFDLSHPDINLIAHLGGLVTGVVFTWIYRRTRSRQKLWTILAYSTGILFALSLVSTKLWI
jgi:rhomboid protease GluP